MCVSPHSKREEQTKSRLLSNMSAALPAGTSDLLIKLSIKSNVEKPFGTCCGNCNAGLICYVDILHD